MYILMYTLWSSAREQFQVEKIVLTQEVSVKIKYEIKEECLQFKIA